MSQSSFLISKMSKQMINALALASVCQARSSQQKYAKMLKLENEAREKWREARRMRERLEYTQIYLDRNVTEEAPYDAKKSKHHKEKEDFYKRFNKWGVRTLNECWLCFLFVFILQLFHVYKRSSLSI